MGRGQPPIVMPTSPAGRQLGWLLEGIRSAGAEVTPQACLRFVSGLPASQGEGEIRRLFAMAGTRFGRFEVESIDIHGTSSLSVVLAGMKGRRWSVFCQVEEAEPHRIVEWNWDRVLDFEVVVREAVEADGPALAELERRCPLVLAGRSLTIDRGGDYFAFARLMEDVTVAVGLVDGEIAGVNCGAVRTARVNGVDQGVMIAVHTRIHPEQQGKGLWGALSGLLAEKYPRERGIDGSCGYGSVDNVAIQRGFAHVPEKWDPGPVRALVDCRSRSGPETGRAAAPADASRIVELLNACHGREEMYTPYTVDSLTARLERSPEQYSWGDVWLGERAVVGVWPAGESIAVVTDRDGERSESRRGLVLDYGFSPSESGDPEAELSALIAGCCTRLARRGLDTLSILSSEASPGYATLCALASTTEAFYAWTPGIAVPERLAETGVYVDAIYF